MELTLETIFCISERIIPQYASPQFEFSFMAFLNADAAAEKSLFSKFLVPSFMSFKSHRLDFTFMFSLLFLLLQEELMIVMIRATIIANITLIFLIFTVINLLLLQLVRSTG